MAIIYVALVYFFNNVIMLPSYSPPLRFFHGTEEGNNMYDLLNDYLDTLNVRISNAYQEVQTYRLLVLLEKITTKYFMS